MFHSQDSNSKSYLKKINTERFKHVIIDVLTKHIYFFTPSLNVLSGRISLNVLSGRISQLVN